MARSSPVTSTAVPSRRNRSTTSSSAARARGLHVGDRLADHRAAGHAADEAGRDVGDALAFGQLRRPCARAGRRGRWTASRGIGKVMDIETTGQRLGIRGGGQQRREHKEKTARRPAARCGAARESDKGKKTNPASAVAEPTAAARRAAGHEATEKSATLQRNQRTAIRAIADATRRGTAGRRFRPCRAAAAPRSSPAAPRRRRCRRSPRSRAPRRAT